LVRAGGGGDPKVTRHPLAKLIEVGRPDTVDLARGEKPELSGRDISGF
jgi:hypothetical protein